jgi:hypothetical protein
VVEVDELGREDVINESVKLLLNNDARPVVFKTEGGRRTVIRLGHLNDAPKEYTVIIFDVDERQLGEAKSDEAPPNQKHQI